MFCSCAMSRHQAVNGVRRIVATFGNGDCGRLGHGDPLRCVEIPKQIGGDVAGVNVSGVACGGAHSVVATEDGRVFSFGLNDRGQLGHSQMDPFVSTPEEVLIPEDIVSVAAGHYHSLALDRNGNIWSWGSNDQGQLGLGANVGRIWEPRLVTAIRDTVISEIAAGASHSLAVSKNGELFTWGEGDSGRLGHGAPSQSLLSWITNQQEHLPRKVRAFETKIIQHAYAGHMHSACIDVEGQLYTFGSGRSLQLGTGTVENCPKPVHIHGLGSVASAACGGMHTIASLFDGNVFAWGADQNGCLGMGSKGSSGNRRPERVPRLGAVAQVSAGWKHSAAIDRNGRLFSWGWGGSQGTAISLEGPGSGGGQLGIGDDCDAWEPRLVPAIQSHMTGDIIPAHTSSLDKGHLTWKGISVSCGLNHTAIVAEILNSS